MRALVARTQIVLTGEPVTRIRSSFWLFPVKHFPLDWLVSVPFVQAKTLPLLLLLPLLQSGYSNFYANFRNWLALYAQQTQAFNANTHTHKI